MGNSPIRFCAVGDLMLAGGVSRNALTSDSDYPFEEFNKGRLPVDLMFGNLETPLAGVGSQDSYPTPKFSVSPTFAPKLRQAGFDVVSLANNHIRDAGIDGIRTTQHALERNGISHIGSIPSLSEPQEPAKFIVRDQEVGLLGYALSGLATESEPGAAPAAPRRMADEIGHLSDDVENVVVSIHQGYEFAPGPGIRHMSLLKSAIRAGADVVLGHHPHVPHGIIRTNRSVAFASLGNCVSDMADTKVRSENIRRTMNQGNPFSMEYYDRCVEGLAAFVNLDGGVKSVEAKWLMISDSFEPRLGGVAELKTCRAWAATMVEIKYQISRLRAEPRARAERLINSVLNRGAR